MNAAYDLVDELAREIGLDREEVEARKAYLELDEPDIEALHDVHGLLASQHDALSDRFYAHLMSFPKLRGMLGDGAEARLRHAQDDYLSSLTAGDYDEEYIRDRLRVGATHQRIGLDPKWYIGAYRKYLSELAGLLQRRLHGQPERYHAAMEAVLNIF